MEDSASVTAVAVFIACMALAIGVAMMTYGSDQGMLCWSGALAMHALVFGLITFPGTIALLISAGLANVALACMFALLTESVFHLQHRRPPHRLIWPPVLIIALGFVLVWDNVRGRAVLAGIAYFAQLLFLIGVLLQRRDKLRHAGVTLFFVGALVVAIAYLLRAINFASEAISLPPLIVAGPIQTGSFLLSIVSLMLATLGFELLIRPRGGNRKHD